MTRFNDQPRCDRPIEFIFATQLIAVLFYTMPVVFNDWVMSWLWNDLFYILRSLLIFLVFDILNLKKYFCKLLLFSWDSSKLDFIDSLWNKLCQISKLSDRKCLLPSSFNSRECQFWDNLIGMIQYDMGFQFERRTKTISFHRNITELMHMGNEIY